MNTVPLKTEIGGNHYQQFKVQPIELIGKCKWNFFQGNIAKYILRHQLKNGLEDLKKALHYCALGVELDDSRKELRGLKCNDKTFFDFICDNHLGKQYLEIFKAIDFQKYEELVPIIEKMIEEYEKKTSK